MRRGAKGAKGAKDCKRGALHPGDGAETKGAMQCILFHRMTLLLHPYASLMPASPMRGGMEAR